MFLPLPVGVSGSGRCRPAALPGRPGRGTLHAPLPASRIRALAAPQRLLPGPLPASLRGLRVRVAAGARRGIARPPPPHRRLSLSAAWCTCLAPNSRPAWPPEGAWWWSRPGEPAWRGVGSAHAAAESLTALSPRFLVDLRPEQLQAFAARVGELAGAAGFTPRASAGPAETFARFTKPGTREPDSPPRAPPATPPVAGAPPPPTPEGGSAPEPQGPSLTSKGGSGGLEPPAGF